MEDPICCPYPHQHPKMLGHTCPALPLSPQHELRTGLSVHSAFKNLESSGLHSEAQRQSCHIPSTKTPPRQGCKNSHNTCLAPFPTLQGAFSGARPT